MRNPKLATCKGWRKEIEIEIGRQDREKFVASLQLFQSSAILIMRAEVSGIMEYRQAILYVLCSNS